MKSPTIDPKEVDFLQRLIDAYRAYFENMPIRLSTLPVREGRRQLYRSFDYGRLMSLHMLDERQYRDPQACRFDKLPGGKNVGLADCAQLESNRTILGAGRAYAQIGRVVPTCLERDFHLPGLATLAQEVAQIAQVQRDAVAAQTADRQVA